jgi:sec-independent protein translocase protein TatB
MSGIAPSEFILICLIALMILGPERLPGVTRKIGAWLGKARQMSRSIQRQLEDEMDVEKNFGFDPKELDPNEMLKPRDDDTFSPLHDEDDDDDEDIVNEPAEKPAK